MGLKGALLRACMLLCLSAIAWSLSTDQAILRVLSAELKGHGSIWNTSEHDPCSWAGVHCHGDRVTNLTLQRLHLSGTISPSFSLLQSLTILDLSRNSLIGSIPANLSHCRSLSLLNLSSNSLSGSIPAELQKLSLLQSLDLSSNSLSGRIPHGLGNLSALQALNLASNSFKGVIPSDFGNLLALEDLSLAQNLLTGTIPWAIGNLSKLQRFSAYQNTLDGSMPLMLNRNLQWVNLASNRLSGAISENICASGQLRVLILTNNSFVGALPENLGSCAPLSALRVGHNLLTGVIPDTFGQLGNLIYFEANGNRLTGQIPSRISGWENLSLLNLADNSLSGNIPVELSKVSNLQELRLSGNRLTGEIPEGLSQCKLLSVIDLSKNNLSGNIPNDLCKVSKVVYLLLEGNSFSGAIPSTIGDCQQLLELQLSNNKFSDSIPTTLGNLSNLQVSLNLSLNQLTGTIPASLGSLTKLVSLDLSHNELSGEIPASLATMVSLLDWNFAYNFLTGPVPRIGSTLNSSSSISSSSYANNSGLCGGPLPSCHVSPSGKSTSRRAVISFWKVAGIAVTCAIVTLMIFSGIAGGVMCKRHLSSTVDYAPPLTFSHAFMDNFEPAISFERIKDAICSNAHVISSNHFSCLYKAVLPSGLVLAVKKLHSTSDKSLVAYQKKMAYELDKLFRLSHENIMQPVGYAIQIDYAIILYDFVPMCTLGQQLHGNDEQPLTWAMRYEIALGTAHALTFLHHSCHPPMVHMDINSNNVFLGSHFEVKVGDVEVAKLLDPTKNTGSISAVAGSLGYIAPEYAFTMQVTQSSNVYSFGVILLELLTGQLPIDETFGDGLDLVRWVHEASLRGETPEQILDPRISTLSFGVRQEMLAVLKVALQCTNSSPLRRPRMKKVLEMLRESKLQGKAH